MFDIQNYYSFILAIVAFQLFPGAGTLVILQSTASGGIKSGMFAVYGTLLGDLIYMSSAVLGLAAILQTIPFILKFAQYIGVLYLVIVGLQKLVVKVGTKVKEDKLEKYNCTVFKEALVICLTNPKAIMFFMAFFPLFLTQDSKPITLLAMMIHITAISLIYQTGLVVLGNILSQLVSRWKYSKIIATRLAGIAFIAFGVKLARNI